MSEAVVELWRLTRALTLVNIYVITRTLLFTLHGLTSIKLSLIRYSIFILQL